MRVILSLAAALTLISGAAEAQFEIEPSTTASQEVRLEIVNTIRTGSVPVNLDRSEHSFGVRYGALTGWAPKLSFIVSNPRNVDPSLSAFRFSSIIAILGGEVSDSAFSLGFYSGVNYDFDVGSNRYVEVGPTMGYEQANWSLALNTFFTIPLNDGKTGFRYAFGGDYDINSMFAVGAQAHGTVSSVFDSPKVSRDEHVIGPTIKLALDPEGREVEFTVGTFFGLTDASPTMAVSANVDFGF